MADYESRRDSHIAHSAAAIAQDYKKNVKSRESFPLSYRVAQMERELDDLLRIFAGYEGEFGL